MEAASCSPNNEAFSNLMEIAIGKQNGKVYNKSWGDTYANRSLTLSHCSRRTALRF